MRVNVYAEEMTERIEIIKKEIDGHTFTGLRLYLELPCTLPSGENVSGPFLHRPGDNDSAAVTFWGKRDLRVVLRKMLAKLDEHYDGSKCSDAGTPSVEAGDPPKGSRLWRCEQELAKARAESQELRNALETANAMVVRHTMPYGWPDFQARNSLRSADEILRPTPANSEGSGT